MKINHIINVYKKVSSLDRAIVFQLIQIILLQPNLKTNYLLNPFWLKVKSILFIRYVQTLLTA